MKVVVSDEAQRQIRAGRRWWRMYRDAKHVFADELRAALAALSGAPKREVYGYFDGEPVRRLLLEKVHCHLYYLIDERAGIVRVLALWGAQRSSPPKDIEPRG